MCISYISFACVCILYIIIYIYTWRMCVRAHAICLSSWSDDPTISHLTRLNQVEAHSLTIWHVHAHKTTVQLCACMRRLTDVYVPISCFNIIPHNLALKTTGPHCYTFMIHSYYIGILMHWNLIGIFYILELHSYYIILPYTNSNTYAYLIISHIYIYVIYITHIRYDRCDCILWIYDAHILYL